MLVAVVLEVLREDGEVDEAGPGCQNVEKCRWGQQGTTYDFELVAGDFRGRAVHC